VEALARVYKRKNDESQYSIGSVKSNIGHLDAAAGVVGLIKAAMSLRKKQIVPTLHYQKPNPAIPFEQNGMRVTVSNESWLESDGEMRSAVSAFGIGGTNAHVILESAPAAQEEPTIIANDDSYHLLCLSAKSESQLTKMLSNLGQYIKRHNDINLSDIAYTLRCHRNHYQYRYFVVCKTQAESVLYLSKQPIEFTGSFNLVDGKEFLSLSLVKMLEIFCTLKGRSSN